VAQGWPKRGARVEWKKCFVCNKRREKAGWGGKIADIAVIARHRRDRKGKILPRRRGDAEKNKDLPLICADGR